jgi:hypothetical protein
MEQKWTAAQTHELLSPKSPQELEPLSNATTDTIAKTPKLDFTDKPISTIF